MSKHHEGGCLCGAIRYEARAEPVRTTICHCRFCQRLTGSAFLVEPIFDKADLAFSGAAPQIYAHRSAGSHKRVFVHFCGRCGAHLYLAFERFPDVIGVCGGTFDDPNWFDRSPARCRHIFTQHAQKGVVLPAGAYVFEAHAVEADGTSNMPRIYGEPMVVA